jgi:hypothetical protein
MAALPKARLIAGAIFAATILVTIHAVFSVYRIVTTTAPDFFYYYQAAQAMTSGVTRPIYVLPPASVLLYSPLGLLPYDVSQTIWVIASSVCLVLAVWKLGAMFSFHGWQIALIGILMYVSFPTRFTLGMGQVNLIALILIVSAVSLVRKKYTYIAGGLFAGAILLKPELVLLLPVFVWAKQWSLFGIVGALIIIGEVVARWILGTAAYTSVGTIVDGFIQGWGNAGVYYNQGLSGLLVRAGVIQPWMYVVLMFGVLMTTMIVRIKRPLPFESLLWSSMPILMLGEPIAWQHHFVFLLPTFVWLWVTKTNVVYRVLLLISFVLISVNFASPGFLDTMPLGWLFASHGTVGVIVLWMLTL